MENNMVNEREEYIRFIRCKLPYANDRQLGRIASLVRVMEICGYSPSEQERPVLSEEEQRRQDAATRCIWSVTDAIRDGEYGFDPNGGKVLLGYIDGEVAVLDASEVVCIYKDAGWVHVKRDYLFCGMEDVGFIIPRNRKPKTAIINGKRREVLYVPVKNLVGVI